MSLKKILIILIIVLSLVIGALLIYNLFLGEETTEPTTEPSAIEQPSQVTKSLLPSQINVLSQESVLNPTIDGQKVKYYSASNGNILKSNFDGSGLIRVSSTMLPGLLKALWSVNKDKVIAIFTENNQPKKFFYDYSADISASLDKEIRWLTWSPNEDKIAYQYYDSQTEDNNISIADPDGSNWENILKTRMKNLIVEWPSQEQLAIRTKPSGLAQSVIYTIDLSTNNFRKILNETNGLTVLWSPVGDKFLFSETNNQGKNLKLKIADLAKSTIAELDFATLPEKCVWSEDNRTIFCAVPKTIPNSAVLPDYYYKEVVSFNDDFWRINLDIAEAIQVYETTGQPAMAFDAKELLLSPLEDYLIFVNNKDGLLYSLEL